MFLRILSFVLTLSLLPFSAGAATNRGLKAAFDEMSYALTVEWDQKDPEFYEATMRSFRHTVRELQRQGVTNAELLEFAKSQVKDARLARDLDTAFSVITVNRLTPEEATKHVVETVKRAYSKGANWTGDPMISFLIAAVIVAVIAGLILTGGGGGDGGGDGGTSATPGTGTGKTPECSYSCSYKYGYTYNLNCTFPESYDYAYTWCYHQSCDNICY